MSVVGTEAPEVIRGDRDRAVWRLVLGVGLLVCALAVWSVSPAAAWLGLFLFGVLTPFLVWLVIDPGEMRIGRDGLEWRRLWRRRSVRWSETRGFQVWMRRMGLLPASGVKYVAILYAGETDAAGLGAGASAGRPRLIPGAGWGMPAEALCDRIEQARRRWTVQGWTQTAGPWSEASPAPTRPLMLGQRVSRKGYWIGVGGVFAMALVSAMLFGHGGTPIYGAAAIWLWLFRRRLHDIGESGWWALTPLAVGFAMGVLVFLDRFKGPILLVPGLPLETAAVGLAMLVHFAFAVWLGAQRGDPEANRYGPPPVLLQNLRL